jgi:gas vesicle protein
MRNQTLEERKEMKSQTAKTDRAVKTARVAKAVGAALAGATIGYVAGTLTAPASGRETRRRIGRRVEDETQGIARQARRSLATAKDGAQDLASKAKKSLTTAKDKLADKLHS